MSYDNWIQKCKHWKSIWPIYIDEYKCDNDGINLYTIIECLNEFSKDNDVFIVDAGSTNYVGSQNLRLKENQFFINPGSQGDMGFSIPASIGVGLANEKLNPIVIVGDGSFNTNSQELATIKANNIKSKILLFDNGGYLSIRNTQMRFYDNHVYGESLETGLYFPNYQKISDAYELKYIKINNNKDLYENISKYLHSSECIIFHIKCKFVQDILPNLTLKIDEYGNKTQCGLEDMYPFLSNEELMSEMIIDQDEQI